jgi:hypothetical protein
MHLGHKVSFQIIKKRVGLPFKDSRRNTYLTSSPQTLVKFKISPDSRNPKFKIIIVWRKVHEDFRISPIRNRKLEIGN